MTDVTNDLPYLEADTKCPTNDPDEVLQRKAENWVRPVNKLPVEVLSRIFAIGEEEDRQWRQFILSQDTYTNFQELASVRQFICYTRTIADPTLWTYIHITRFPNELTSLYLDRAGPTTLLDIDISIRSRYWDSLGIEMDDTVSQVKHIPSMLTLFVARGANFNRWRSLCVCTSQWEPLVSFIHMLNGQMARELRLISWTGITASVETTAEPAESNFPTDQLCSLSRSLLPNLSSLRFYELPLAFLFHPPDTAPSNLTHLYLDGGVGKIPLLPSKLQDILSAYPQLEYLQLSSGIRDCQDTSGPVVRHAHWVVSILQRMDTPRLHTLMIHCPSTFGRSAASGQIATYIATGKASSHMYADLDALTPLDPANKPSYPSLRKLDIACYTCTKEELVAMLASLPHITHLCICGEQAECLGEAPWVLPNLVTLRFTRLVYPRLSDTLRNRAEAGLPVKTVQVHKDFGLHVSGELPDTVEIELYPDGLFQRNYVEEYDEDDSEDELDDDDEDDNNEEGELGDSDLELSDSSDEEWD